MQPAQSRREQARRFHPGWIVAGIALLLVAGVAARRFAPAPQSPASQAMRAATHELLSTAATHGPVPQAPKGPRTDRERLLSAAFALRGIPYEWGAKGPKAYDCSGFTKAVYAAGGVALPNGSFNQAQGEKPLARQSELTTGDLILYRWAAGNRVEHITIYAGDGWVIGTGSPGQPKEVVVYRFASDLVNAGRVITYRHVRLADEP